MRHVLELLTTMDRSTLTSPEKHALDELEQTFLTENHPYFVPGQIRSSDVALNRTAIVGATAKN